MSAREFTTSAETLIDGEEVEVVVTYCVEWGSPGSLVEPPSGDTVEVVSITANGEDVGELTWEEVVAHLDEGEMVREANETLCAEEEDAADHRLQMKKEERT